MGVQGLASRHHPVLSLAIVTLISFALQHASPLTFLSIRFAFGILCMAPFVWLVIGASVPGVSAWHYLMRRRGATRLSSLVYLTPAFAIVLEFLLFGITPSTVSWAGIVITCMGVGLVVWRRTTVPPKL